MVRKVRKFPKDIPKCLLSWVIGRISWRLKNEFESVTVNEPSVFMTVVFTGYLNLYFRVIEVLLYSIVKDGETFCGRHTALKISSLF